MGEVSLDGYGGQTTRELLDLESSHRIDSLVLAFEEGVERQAQRRELSEAERYVLAVEALEREVNNGGFAQYFLNSSNETVEDVVDALDAIGCSTTSDLTREAIEALDLGEDVTPDVVEAAVLQEDGKLMERLDEVDERFYDSDEPIAQRLFRWIAERPDEIRLVP